MSDELDLARNQGVSLEALARAPVWLAAGILGVPAAIAIAAGWFIAKDVNGRLKTNEQYHLSELHQLNDIQNHLTAIDRDVVARWEVVRRNLILVCEIELKSCLHEAENKQQVNDCATLSNAERALETMKDPPKRTK